MFFGTTQVNCTLPLAPRNQLCICVCYRYKENSSVLKQKMKEMGFKQLIRDADNPNGYLLTAFKYPLISRFVFDEFQQRLNEEGGNATL